MAWLSILKGCREQLTVATGGKSMFEATLGLPYTQQFADMQIRL